ncbi:nicotinate-nucleotide adenylyltransferase [Flavitalea sp. BT771]|uniref:nicotinate-nucleotide adenylyltransferase n=1 Tax=Flavitalea sp. BT771 TaxID=3063329 RepID=UPI0026E2713D|nr:nicotinate-nucleotide adenylyltransferase [Flavitalea sp. BT771]MDO6428988.1 nicotinate-nucleotide adenylyltransferase [Flavitalea sp. BT771]MDV6218884.1 nicotinate-nucleotide adenylyltransferase [Flavitalea sp. BT771]
MKSSRSKWLLFALALGITSQSFAQEPLPPVTVTAVNYKYLSSVNTKEAAQPVKLLQIRAAAYDVKNSEYYEDDYDEYYISFYIPDGSILAAYDKDGKLLRTIEKFKNIAIPKAISQAVTTRFPQWGITKDVYLVNYSEGKDTKKVYKLLLENGDKRLRVKCDENGNFQ